MSRLELLKQIWDGLLKRLETAVADRVYGGILMLATVALILVYAFIGSRLAEPARFTESAVVAIDAQELESVSGPLSSWQVDQVNRAIGRIEQLSSVLDVRLPRVTLTLQPRDLAPIFTAETFSLEKRALLAWLDEQSVALPTALDDVRADAVARAIVATAFPLSQNSVLSPSDAAWFEVLKTTEEACIDFSLTDVIPMLRARCRTATPAPVSPRAAALSILSASPWLARQIVESWSAKSIPERIQSLRRLVRINGDVTFAQASSIQAELRSLMLIVAPARIGAADQSRIEAIKSCESPRIESLAELVRAEAPAVERVLWVKTCDSRPQVGPIQPSRQSRELNTRALRGTKPAAEKVKQFALDNPRAEFIELSVAELRFALERKMLTPETDVVALTRNVLSRDVIETQMSRPAIDQNLQAQAPTFDRLTKLRHPRAPVALIRSARFAEL